MRALAASTRGQQEPAFVIGPGVDRAQAVDLMVRACGEDKSFGLDQPVLGAMQFSGNPFAVRGLSACFPGQLSDALRAHDLVVVIGAPVFTFHVEGHASIFDGATHDFPDHR